MGDEWGELRPSRSKRHGAPGPKLHRPSWGALAGALPQGPMDRDCPVGLWEVWRLRILRTNISTFILRFTSLNPLNFHGSFQKHLVSLIPSIPNWLDLNNNPKTQIKSILGMQQLNQQEFKNTLQEVHFSSFNLPKITEVNNLVCGWTNSTRKYLTYPDRPRQIPLAIP